jgi:hypothetical protein
MRATGHGISAGVGKLGPSSGFLFPLLQTSLGLRGTLLLTAGVAGLGFALTLVMIGYPQRTAAHLMRADGHVFQAAPGRLGHSTRKRMICAPVLRSAIEN